MILATSLSCSKPESTSPAESPTGGSAIRYSFGTLDGGILGSAAHRGRVTVILFGTTYDIATQAEARRLDSFAREHAPRLNALLVMLEPPQNVDVVRAYGEILSLGYPVVMADLDTLEHRGPFGKVTVVPGWLFLDRNGVVRGVAEGALDLDQLRRMAESVEGRR